jgi:hypothetical protein
VLPYSLRILYTGWDPLRRRQGLPSRRPSRLGKRYNSSSPEDAAKSIALGLVRRIVVAFYGLAWSPFTRILVPSCS